MSSKKVQQRLNKIYPDATVKFGWINYEGEQRRGYIMDLNTGWAKDNGGFMGETLEQAMAHVDNLEVLADL